MLSISKGWRRCDAGAPAACRRWSRPREAASWATFRFTHDGVEADSRLSTEGTSGARRCTDWVLAVIARKSCAAVICIVTICGVAESVSSRLSEKTRHGLPCDIQDAAYDQHREHMYML